MVTNRCCWKRSWKSPALPAPPTGRLIGSASDRLRDGANWKSSTVKSVRSRISGSTPCTQTSAKSSVPQLESPPLSGSAEDLPAGGLWFQGMSRVVPDLHQSSPRESGQEGSIREAY